MRLRCIAVFGFILVSAFQARADDFTIDLTPGWNNQAQIENDYVQRGISQTKGRPSAAVSSMYTLPNGGFASVAAERSEIGQQSIETDVSGGWKTALTSAAALQFDIIYQQYPYSQVHSANNVELQSVVNVKQSWGVIIAALAVQPQSAFHGGLQTYISTGADVNLTDDLKLGGRVGFLTAANHAVQPNYVDWTVTLSRDLGHNLSLGAQYTGLTYRCSSCGNRFVVVLTLTF